MENNSTYLLPRAKVHCERMNAVTQPPSTSRWCLNGHDSLIGQTIAHDSRVMKPRRGRCYSTAKRAAALSAKSILHAAINQCSRRWSLLDLNSAATASDFELMFMDICEWSRLHRVWTAKTPPNNVHHHENQPRPTEITEKSDFNICGLPASPPAACLTPRFKLVQVLRP